MKLTCYVIDDEPLAVSLLESYVKKTPFLALEGTFNSAIHALTAISDHPVDILFLDIQMPELNGLEFSRIVSGETRIIFTTAFERYAADSYKVNALDYLLKPISYPDFLTAANKALQWFEMTRKNTIQVDGTVTPAKEEIESIFVKTEYKLIQIALNKILYIEGLKDYVKIYTEEDIHPILSLMSMKTMEEMLPSKNFIRVHRSYIVQAQKIKVIERNRIVFGKAYISISDNYKPRFMEFLSQRSLLPKGKDSL